MRDSSREWPASPRHVSEARGGGRGSAIRFVCLSVRKLQENRLGYFCVQNRYFFFMREATRVSRRHKSAKTTKRRVSFPAQGRTKMKNKTRHPHYHIHFLWCVSFLLSFFLCCSVFFGALFCFFVSSFSLLFWLSRISCLPQKVAGG